MKQPFKVGLVLLVWVMVSSLAASAQATNLLKDPSFDATTSVNVVADGRGQPLDGTIYSVPGDWGGWVGTSPRNADWMNRIPDGYPHTGLFKIDGARSWSVSRGYATFTAAMYQRVSVAAGTNVRASVRGFMERGKDAAGNTIPGAQFRIGIDPNGGSDPTSGAIIWSGVVTSPNGWVQASIEATAAVDAVTLFLYATQSQPSNPNAMYWDNAILEVGGAGAIVTPGAGTSVAPVVPTPAFAAFVSPQGTQPDGSVIHIVGSGDTIDAIAVAYQTTRAAILELNPGLRPAFIFPGQEILVRPPSTATPSTGGNASASRTPASTLSGTQQATITVQPSGTGTAVSLTPGAIVIGGATSIPTLDISATLDQTPTADLNATLDTTQTATVEVSPEPSNTPTDSPPTLTPTDLPPAPVTQVADVAAPEVTSLCVWVFEDVNQNRIQEEGERLLPDGKVELLQGEAAFREYSTDGVSEPFCFTDVQPGDYLARAVAPGGFGLTTSTSLNLRVQDGVRTNVRFGAAQGVESVQPPAVDTQADAQSVAPIQDTQAVSQTDSLLQIAGLVLFGLAGLVILGGIGVALYVRGR